MTDDTNIIESLTKLCITRQNERLRLFAKVDITTKLKILTFQKQLFHRLKNTQSDVDNTILTLSSLVLAVDSVAKELDYINLNAIKIRGKNNKPKQKRQKLLSYWAIVRTLKEEEHMSFRDISEYFLKYHKFEVSYSTLYQVWNELENNTK